MLPSTLPDTCAPAGMEPRAVPWLALPVESLNCGAVLVGPSDRCQTPEKPESQTAVAFCWLAAEALP